ncbi:hypothetical protein [Escherichia phage dw-ec]|nr:hypothetical protein [Escherichia phage BI-EHEC]UJQ43809.1 hypothetical protein [Escherichia phage dw-ec]
MVYTNLTKFVRFYESRLIALIYTASSDSYCCYTHQSSL